jgi:hypothetical protein
MDENHQDKTEGKTPVTEGKSPLSPLSSQDQRGLMNDNINSRYRQLEMPMRKGNLVAAQQREPERLTFWQDIQTTASSLENRSVHCLLSCEDHIHMEECATARTNGGDVRASLRILID